MESLIFPLPTARATKQLGAALGRSLSAPSILLLDGALGSGKTTLVQGIGEGLGIADLIVSPTFVLVNEYDNGRVPLYHFDLYRLNATETDALAIETYWDSREYAPGILAIEWAERLGDRPDAYLHIYLSTDSPDMNSPDTNSPDTDFDVLAGDRYARLRPVGMGKEFDKLVKLLKKHESD